MSTRFTAGVRYMIAAAFMFSLMSLFVKLAGQRLPSQEIVLVRSIVTLVFSYAGVRLAGAPLWGNDKKWLILRGLAGFAALSCFYYALTRLPLADANVIQYTNPAFTAVLAAVFLRERVGWMEMAGMFLSLAGVAMIARPSFLFGGFAGSIDVVAVGVGLTGALLAASAYVIVRKLRTTENPYVIIFYFPLISTFGSVPTALPVAVWPTPAEWLMLVVGVGLTAQLGQIFMTKGLHLERAGRATAISYLQVLFAAILGIVVFGEYPDVLTLGGALLVVVGTLLASYRP